MEHISIISLIARLLVFGLKELAAEVKNAATVDIIDFGSFNVWDQDGYGTQYVIEGDDHITSVYGKRLEPEGGTVWQFRDNPDWEVPVPANASETAVRVVEALVRTEYLEGSEGVPESYVGNMLKQRLPGGKGSIYQGGYTVETLKDALIGAAYKAKTHTEINEPCVGFVAYGIAGGEYGMVKIIDQPDDAKFVIVDDKKTGKVSLLLVGATGRIPTTETWVILGPANNGEEVFYTFHPGEPIPPATTSTEELPVGTILSKQEALAKGFNLAKVGGN